MGVRHGAARLGRAVRLALTFLTVVPVRLPDGPIPDGDLEWSRYAFPVVGLAAGLVLAGLSAGLTRWGAAPGVSAFLIVAAGAALTGGLHLDGLADTADGVFLWGDRGRRLAVMKDPNVGSYGVAAVVLVVLGKYAVLSGMGGPRRAWAVLLGAVASRTMILVSAGLAGYARPDGTGRVLVGATTRRDALLASALVVAEGFFLAGPSGLVAAATALVLALGLTRLAVVRLGGVTGDTLGALVETTELAVLLVLGLQGG